MKYNAEWIFKYSFWYENTDYLKYIWKQFDFVDQQVSFEALNNIDNTLHYIAQNQYMMIATGVYTDKFLFDPGDTRDTMAEAFEDHPELERFPELEAPREEVAREAILGPATPEINKYVRSVCQKIHYQLNVHIPQNTGINIMGQHYAPSKEYMEKFKLRTFILSPYSIGLTYVFIKALFEGLISTQQIKIITRTICSYYNWTVANKIEF